MRITYRTIIPFLFLVLVKCTPSASTILVPNPELLTVDNTYAADSMAEATIAPFRIIMEEEMDVIIGHSDKQLVEGNGESLLGNFVTDAILEQSRINYPGTVHMSVITNGGLRAPIPKGVIKVFHIYELMPFENLLYILELNSSQTKALFTMLAKDLRVSIANSVVLIEDNKAARIFIDGQPFKEDQTYVLAVSDYLAQGGGGMEFLKEARILATVNLKIRDMIINHIKGLETNGEIVDAEIEGRVKFIP